MDAPKLRQLMAIFNQKGLDEEAQRDLIHTHTNGRTQSKREMTNHEAQLLINNLNQGYVRPQPQQQKTLPGDRQRKKIIGLFRSMGWEKDGKADMERIQAWIVKYGKYNPAKLNQYDLNDLPALVSQVEIFYQDYIRSLSKPAKKQ